VHTRVVDGVGVVHAHVRLRASASGPAVLRVGDHASTLVASPDGRDLHGQLEVADPPLWWPHPYGDQPLLPAVVEIGARAHALGRVGFRDLAARRDDGGFASWSTACPSSPGGFAGCRRTCGLRDLKRRASRSRCCGSRAR
jgi:hypothetical protein